MTDTLHLAMPYIAAAQAQKHVTHNEALRILDAIVMLAVKDRDLSAPPGSPAEGDRYLVKPTGSGSFAGKDNQIAHFRDGAWAFHAPQAGWTCYVEDEDTTLVFDGSAWTHLDARERLTAARTYYVRTDGSDSNDGLTNSAGGALLTIQKALDAIVTTLDVPADVTVTVQVADGTYNESFGAAAKVDGTIVVQGNAANPQNAIVVGQAGALGTAWASNGFRMTVKDMELRNPSTHCLYARWAGVLHYGNIRFGAATGAHVTVSYDGVITAIGDSTAVDDAYAHFFTHAGTIRCEGRTVTFSGTPAFSIAAAYAIEYGKLNLNGSTFSGAASGLRFRASTGGIIHGITSLTALPGDVAGLVESGGFYHNLLSSRREKLVEARTYYVRTDGSDANDGLSNASGGAFLTIQKAVETAFGLDLNGFDVTVQVADGTYTAQISVAKPQVGRGSIIVQGNNSTPANVVISTTNASAVFVDMGAVLYIRDLKIQTATSGLGLLAQRGGIIRFQNVDFGTCAGLHMRAADCGVIVGDGNYAISGGAPVHWSATLHGIVRVQSKTITLSGSPAFSTAFAAADLAGAMVVNGNTFSGAATGTRYSAATNGLLHTGGASATYLPGDAAGSIATGGQYV